MRPRRLLRLVEEPPRLEALFGDGHPIIRSLERGEDWAWRYPDETYL